MKRATWLLLEQLLEATLERRRRLEAETVECDGEEIPAEGELAAEWDGSLPALVDSAQMAKALEDLRDSEVFE